MRMPGEPSDPRSALGVVRWTLQALEILAPEAFLLVFLSTPGVLHPEFRRILERVGCRPLLVALEAARMGRRRAELHRATGRVREAGHQVAVWGHRLVSATGFDALIVTPRSAAVSLHRSAEPLMALGVDTQEDLDWAMRNGAVLMSGEIVGKPVKVAPVDLQRLRR